MRDLKELRLWLEGTEPAQVAWRLDDKNIAQVSEFVGQYAKLPGGRSASWMGSKIRREREIHKAKQEATASDQKQREALVEAVRSDYIANGGLEAEFKARQASILEAYAISGRGRAIIDRIEAYKRNQAARTW